MSNDYFESVRNSIPLVEINSRLSKKDNLDHNPNKDIWILHQTNKLRDNENYQNALNTIISKLNNNSNNIEKIIDCRNDLIYFIKYFPQSVFCYCLLAEIYLFLQDYKQAQENFKLAYDRIICREQDRTFQESQKELISFISQNIKSVLPYLLLGKIHFLNNKIDLMVNNYLIAISKFSDDKSAEEVEIYIKDFIKSNSQNIIGYCLLAELYFITDNNQHASMNNKIAYDCIIINNYHLHQQSSKELENFIKLNPNSLLPYLLLGEIARFDNDFDLMQTNFLKVIVKVNDHESFNEVENYINRFLHSEVNSAIGYYLLAELYFTTGNIQKANQLFEEAIKYGTLFEALDIFDRKKAREEGKFDISFKPLVKDKKIDEYTFSPNDIIPQNVDLEISQPKLSHSQKTKLTKLNNIYIKL